MLKLFVYIVPLCFLLFMSGGAAWAENADSSTVAPYLKVLDRNPNDQEALWAVGFHYLGLGNNAEARKYGRRLLEVGEKDCPYAELYGHLILGLADIESRNSTKSYEHLEMARNLAERMRNHEALTYILNGFGHYALFVHDDTYSALSYYFQALDEVRICQDVRMHATLLSNISGVYWMRNDISGLKFAKEAIDIARKGNKIIPLFYGTVNAALYYLIADSLPQARNAIEEIERMYEKTSFEGEEADLDFLQALLCEKEGNKEKAYRHYASAIRHFTSASPSTITKVYIEYARLLRNDQHIRQAIEILEQGLARMDSTGIPIHKSQLLRELSLSYHEAGNDSQALAYAFECQQYQDRRFDEIRERATQEARIKHDIYSREQQINAQHLEILDNRFKITLFTVVLVLLLLALGMTFYFYKKKNRLYRAIVSQNREYMQREQLLMKQMENLHSDETTQAVSAPFPSDKLSNLLSRFTTLMIEQKLFTDPSLTVASVADRLGTNRTYLSKTINESTGKTFTQLINDYRIREAIAQMSDFEANKPLKQIAAEVGFSSLSTFYATFQSSTGMTPARYRLKLKEI